MVGKDLDPINPTLFCVDWIYFCFTLSFSTEAREILPQNVLLLHYLLTQITTIVRLIIIVDTLIGCYVL